MVFLDMPKKFSLSCLAALSERKHSQSVLLVNQVIDDNSIVNQDHHVMTS